MTNEPATAETAPEEKKNGGAVSFLFDILEMFAWAFLFVFLLFTFVFRLCEVDGRSMENTLHNGEKLLLISAGYTPEQDDIIVFHLTDPENGLEKTLVKRVIATEGQTVRIDFHNKEIYVDGILYEDTHSVLKDYSDNVTGLYMTVPPAYGYNYSTHVFEATVPEHSLFVLGDNRNNSKDSRSSEIGFVDERCVLGKVALRFSPFTAFD